MRMRNSSSTRRQQFLEKWQKGLQIYTATKKNMNILERKRAIKITADVAMASSRNGRTIWSRALLANASSQDAANKNLVKQMMLFSPKEEKKASMVVMTRLQEMSSKRVRSKRVLKRSHIATRVMRKMGSNSCSVVAKSLMRKRTQVLKRLVPGGEYLDDDVSLIRETLDYIASLRVQVDVMRSTLASASDGGDEHCYFHCKKGQIVPQ